MMWLVVHKKRIAVLVEQFFFVLLPTKTIGENLLQERISCWLGDVVLDVQQSVDGNFDELINNVGNKVTETNS